MKSQRLLGNKEKHSVKGQLSEAQIRFYRDRNIPWDSNHEQISLPMPPVELHRVPMLDFVSGSLTAQQEAAKTKKHRELLVESIHKEFEKQCNSQAEVIDILRQQLQESKRTLNSEKERLAGEVLLSRLEVERLTRLCRKLNQDCEASHRQLSKINESYDEHLLGVYCGIREEFSEQTNELKARLSEAAAAMKAAYTNQLLLLKKEANERWWQLRRLHDESLLINQDIHKQLLTKQELLDQRERQLAEFLQSQLTSNSNELLNQLAEAKKTIGDHEEQQEYMRIKLQEYQTVISKLKNELEICSDQIVELKASNSRLSINLEGRSKAAGAVATKQATNETKLQDRLRELESSLQFSKSIWEGERLQLSQHLQKAKQEILYLKDKLANAEGERQQLEHTNLNLRQQLKESSDSVEISVQKHVKIATHSQQEQEYLIKMDRLEGELKKNIEELEAELKERDQRIVLLQDRAESLRTELQTLEVRYRERLESITESIEGKKSRELSSSSTTHVHEEVVNMRIQIDAFSRQSESLERRALQLQEKLQAKTSELAAAQQQIQRCTKHNERLQRQLDDKTTQVELMVRMIEEQASAKG